MRSSDDPGDAMPGDGLPEGTALEVRGLSVSFKKGTGRVRVVDNVSFSIGRGARLGIVGESGSGKSVTALSIMRLVPPAGRKDSGEIFVNARPVGEMSEDALRRMRGSEVSMIFQEPMTSLNPVHTVGRQMVEAIRLHRDMPRREALGLAVELLRRVELSDPERRLSAYPHQLSGGICQRVMIAMALVNRPDLVIADEPTTALDATTQVQILALLEDLCAANRTSVLLITHDLGVVSTFCDSVVVMYAGTVVENGTTAQVLRYPRHPYTVGLMAARPPFHWAVDELHPIPGDPPVPGEIAGGCAFAPRCPMQRPICRKERPPLRELVGGHLSACHFAEEVVSPAEVGRPLQ